MTRKPDPLTTPRRLDAKGRAVIPAEIRERATHIKIETFNHTTKKGQFKAFTPPLALALLAALALLCLLCVEEGGATKTGDVYPGTGNWNIANPTTYTNESETIAGNIHILPGGSLIFDNGTLDFTAGAAIVIQDELTFKTSLLKNDHGIITIDHQHRATFLNSQLLNIGGPVNVGSYRMTVKGCTLTDCTFELRNGQKTFRFVNNSMTGTNNLVNFATNALRIHDTTANSKINIFNNTFDGQESLAGPAIEEGLNVANAAGLVLDGNTWIDWSIGLKLTGSGNLSVNNETFLESTGGVWRAGEWWESLTLINTTWFNVTGQELAVYYNNTGPRGVAVDIYNSEIYWGRTTFEDGTIINQYFSLNVTVQDADLIPLPTARVLAYETTGAQVLNITTNQQGVASWLWFRVLEDAEERNPFKIVATYQGQTLTQAVEIAGSGNFTATLPAPAVRTFRIAFFNAFTGIGENADLLRIYYQMPGNGWTRTDREATFDNITFGNVVRFQVRDYFNYIVSTVNVTATSRAYYFVDIPVPLATLHLENVFNLTTFEVFRGEQKITLYGTEIQIIADFEGLGGIPYRIHWAATTEVLKNGTTRTIKEGNYTFAALAGTGNAQIIQDLGVKMTARYSAQTPNEGSQPPPWTLAFWMKTEAGQALAALMGLGAVVLALFLRSSEIADKITDKKAERREGD